MRLSIAVDESGDEGVNVLVVTYAGGTTTLIRDLVIVSNHH